MTKVRTRFSPSPTGIPHIGNMRTAMYAWLWARHHGGTFILRIEDTDQKRKVAGAVRYMIEALEWLGLDVDEGPSPAELEAIGEHWEGAPVYGGPCGPYVQSLRGERYREVAEQLQQAGWAYRCDCTPERLAQERAEQQARQEPVPGYSGFCRERAVSADTEHVTRFKLPAAAKLVLHDVVRGPVTWESPSLRDPVLIKSDGLPTYHLASVVDDHDMAISHVMRGEEWLGTTPIHLLLYEALGWVPPLFCHLSQVLGVDGKKLSKRHGAVSVDVFKEQGYLPQALLNYVVHVGWNPGEGEEQEVFSRSELIERFALEGLSKAGGVFDFTKLQWMNGVYFRQMAADEFAVLVAEEVARQGWEFGAVAFSAVAPQVQERVKLRPDIIPLIEFLYCPPRQWDFPGMLKKGLDQEQAGRILHRAAECCAVVNPFSAAAIEAALRALAEEMGVKLGVLGMVLRVAVSGRTVSLPLFESLAALGAAAVSARLNAAAAALAAGKS